MVAPASDRVQTLHERWAALQASLDRLETCVFSSPADKLQARWQCIEERINKLSGLAGVEVQQGATTQKAEDAAKPSRGITPGASPTQQRLEQELIDKGFSEFRFVRVPGDYYDRPLEYRQGLLNAASVDHLCKSIIMENTRIHPSAMDEKDPLSPKNWANPCNSRYYVIIVQYTAKLHGEKLKNLIHKMNAGSVGKQFFNMRLAPEDVNDALSGYTHNAVTPIGMKVPDLPMILSHKIAHLHPEFFFLGGGEVDLKVGLLASEFVQKYKPIVADITYD